ncbi:DUF86 domain-containing protein [bacterium]|nr:DUF86 domain-containing protein [bacterium]MBU1064767.1 DUF86 domain-containing protein [bacterium]MBU1633083.1 DUF86 domain-containing protein [bacterium]MBU1872990.1 DUF86 domain-containing protein [bacterium]
MSKKDQLYLDDILESAQAIQGYVENIDLLTFIKDRKTYSATIREFQIIGEAVNNLSDDIKSNYPKTAWQDIKDFRNILIHEYFGIDLELVWNVIQEDLPELINIAKEIKKSL